VAPAPRLRVCLSMMKMKLTGLTVGLALCWANFAAKAEVPETAKKPVSNEYQGIKVQDDYQWLENDDDPQVKAWSDAQNQLTRSYLDKLPDHAAIEKQLTEWYAKTAPSYSSLVGRPGILFALK